ncbi:Diphthamide biosynthesis protein 3 [Diatrype stigma]|uniref:Diphthamide biosynthesis protein 3 n=1 Tax=Diatrype stigma TaxID=117547 RepID=A0AAN9V2G4_9PEZI
MADEEIAVYDEVEIEDMEFDENLQVYHYPCPCGDKFEIALGDLQDDFNDIAVCPSCSLMIRVIYDQENLWKPTPKPDEAAPIPEPSEQQIPIAA